MTREEIKAVRILIVEGAKGAFEEDYGMLLDNDDTKIKEQERLDSYIEGAEDVLEILEKSFCKEWNMIAIKDTEMPKSCYNCGFVTNLKTNDYGSFCECGILQDYEIINLLEHSKHPNCPLVEIVTCKDCKYYRNKGDKYSYCTKRLNVDSITDRYREPNFYCADAERREKWQNI